MWFITPMHFLAEFDVGSADSTSQPNPQTNKESNQTAEQPEYATL